MFGLVHVQFVFRGFRVGDEEFASLLFAWVEIRYKEDLLCFSESRRKVCLIITPASSTIVVHVVIRVTSQMTELSYDCHTIFLFC